MTTMQERPAVVGAPGATGHPELTIGMLVIGLLVGPLGGWLLFGSDDVITVDGTTLTDRQIEMTELIDESFEAWQANDGETVVSHYTDSGVFVADSDEYCVHEGSVEGFVRVFGGPPRMETVGEKIVVDDNKVVTFHTYSGVTYTNVLHFKTAGEVLIPASR